MILTKEEYDRMLREKAQAEQEKRYTAYEAEKAIKRAQDTTLGRAQKAEEEARRIVEGMERELTAEKAESAYQRRLNANLLRISKKRANANRKLTPKKEHTGYVVISSAEKEYRYKSSLEGSDDLGDGIAESVFGGLHRGACKKTNAG